MPIIEVEHGGAVRRLEVEPDFLRLSHQDQASAALRALGTDSRPTQGRSGDVSVQIEGIPRPVRVDASFRNLSPEQQGEVVDDIRRTWDARQRAAQPDTSTGSALRSGVAGMAQGIGRTIGLAGAPETGAAIAGAVDAPQGYQSAGAALVDNVRNWDLRGAAANLPRAVVEQLPDMGATMAAGAAGARIGGAGGAVIGGPVGAAVGAGIGGLVGAAGYTGLRAFGDNAYARAENNGRQEPTTGDAVAAIPGTLAQSALGAVGARGLGVRTPATTVASPPVGAAGRLRAATSAAAREGATEVPEDIAGQIGQTLGTDRGLDVDPAQALAAGLTGAATRGAISAPAAVVRGGAESVVMRAAERMAGDMNPEEAASFVRVAEMFERHQEAVSRVTGRSVRSEDVLNGLRGELAAEVSTLMDAAERQGWIDQGNKGELQAVFESAIRHNRALADEDGDDGLVAPLGLARIDALPAPDQFKAALRTAFRDLDTLATASRKRNLTGPFERLFDLVGRGTGIAAGAALGGGQGAVFGALGAVAGNPLGARVGGAVGRSVDRAAGMDVPHPLLARRRALALAQSAGIEPGNTRQMLGEVRQVLGDERQAARAAVGLPIDPPASRQDTRTEAARTPQDGPGDTAGTSPPAGAETSPVSPTESAAPMSGPSMPPGWVFGIMRFAHERNGVALHADDIDAALNRLEERGALRPDEVAAIRGAGGTIPRSWQQMVTAEALDAAGIDPRNPFAGRAGGTDAAERLLAGLKVRALAPRAGEAGGGGDPIRDPVRWHSAAASYQAAADRAVRAGQTTGDYELAELAGTMAVMTLTELPTAVRQFRADVLIGAAPDPETRARRRAMLAPLIRDRS